MDEWPGSGDASTAHDAEALAVARQVEKAQLAVALEAAALGAWDWDLRRDHIAWDARSRAMLGLGEGTSRTSFDDFMLAVHPDDRALVTAAWREVAGATGPLDVEYRVVWPDGSHHWLYTRGTVLVDASGRGVRVEGITADVSESRQLTHHGAEDARTMAALVSVARSLGDADSADDVLAIVVESAASLLGAAGAGLTTGTDGVGADLTRAGARAVTTTSLADRADKQVADHPADSALPMVASAARGASFFLSDRSEAGAAFPGSEDLYLQARTQASAAVPLRSGGTLLGSLSIAMTERHTWREAEKDLLGALAAATAQALSRLAAREAERAVTERLVLLREVSDTLDTQRQTAMSSVAGLPFDAQHLAGVLVPTLADWCTLTLAQASGRLRTVGWAHQDADLEPALRAYAAVQAEDMRPESAIPVVLRTGGEVVIPAMPPPEDWPVPPDVRALLETLAPASAGVLPLKVEGRTIGALALVAAAGRAPMTGTELLTAREVARRIGSSIEGARLRARTELVSAVTKQLSDTLVAEDAVAGLARQLVPTLADWCVITLAEGEQRAGTAAGLRDVSWAHVDPDKLPAVEAYAACRLGSLDDRAYLMRSLDSGRVTRLDSDAAARIHDVLKVARARELILELAPESAVALPLRSRGRAVGLISLLNGPARGPLSPEELATARDIADRAGLALDSARQYRQQRDLATALQRLLLTDPPEPDHMQIVVRYVASAEAARVGGDWYDAFIQRGGDTVVVIGDVVGHDSDAAAAMGQVRSIVRTLGVVADDGPAAILQQTDAVIEALGTKGSDVTASALIGRLEQSEQQRRDGLTTLRWSNAGHPPALIIEPEGTVRALDIGESDLLLGVVPDAERTEHTLTLSAGATVLFYTDGLVERRGRSLAAGLDRLGSVVSELAAAGSSLDELVDALVENLTPADAEDDVAVLAVRLHRQPSG